MVMLQKLENIIKLTDGEFIYKYYQAFKYLQKNKELCVIVTNRRLILLSLNMNNHSQIRLEEYPLSVINKFTIEYGQIVLTKKIITFILLLIGGIISLGSIIYIIFNFNLLGLIIGLVLLNAFVVASIFVFTTRKREVFLFEAFNKFQNQQIISIVSSNYVSSFSKNNYYKVHNDTFQMLSEISGVISQAKKLTKEPIVTIEEKITTNHQEQLNLVI